MSQVQIESLFEVNFVREQSLRWEAKDAQKEFYFERAQKQVIGSGTYGKVFKQKSKDDQKYYALKEIKVVHEKEGFPITALREIKFLKCLNHVNILKIKDIITKRKVKNGVRRIKTYCVLDFMDIDAYQILAFMNYQKKQLPVEVVQSILYQSLLGVQYLHSKRIMHRDIKSANVLLNQNGEVKIADFGLAKFIMKYNLYRRTPTVVTLSYRAPEVLFTKGNYDFKIDIWSLGCFAFELAFGYTIFNGRNEQEHVKQMVEICGTPQEDTWPGITSNEVFQASCPQKEQQRKLISYIRNKNVDINDDLLDLIDRMLTMNPSQRISIDQALKHSFFKDQDSLSATLQRLKNCVEQIIQTKESQEKQPQKPITNFSKVQLTQKFNDSPEIMVQI